ncbi:MAG: hypothetical protein ABI073_03910 [Luteolibacter sp.]
MREGDNPTEVRDFSKILSARLDGELPLLVGGHAVNLWAWVYRERIGEALNQWLPLTSKDLDLVGTVAMLDELKQRFGGQYRLSGPRSPVVGQMVVRLGDRDLKIDVLRNVFGLGPKDLMAGTPQLDVKDEGGAFAARVILPVTLFQAKIANLARLDQTGRNDFKHVNLMRLVIGAYLSEFIEAAESGVLDSRGAIIQLELTRKVITSPEAIKCTASHEIDFSGIWPRELLAQAKDSRLQNFVKHRLPPAV